MNIYDFSNEADCKALMDSFKNHFKMRNFVPFFGSGFTKGCPAHKGRVPSADDLKKKLVEIVVKIRNYSKDEQKRLAQKDLDKVASHFWKALQDVKTETIKNVFSQFIEDNFSDVHDLSREKCRLIDCSWRYLYTLNYDDALEKASQDLYSIIPFVNQNKSWLEGKRCLYKLHGDALQFLKTGEEKYCILSKQQYLNALHDPSNRDMMEKLETDFLSNNLIFFGCSLVNEPDLLFTADTKLARDKAQNSDTHCYYVRYIDSKDQPLTDLEKDELEQFSITDIIEVTSEEMPSFYSFVRRASDAIEAISESDDLAEFQDFHFATLDRSAREDNIEYLFYSNKIQPNNLDKQILLPSFFVRRRISQEIVANISSQKNNFHVLRGGRLSGKTYVLIDILRLLQAKTTYYFRSGREITSSFLQKLLTLENSIFLFDEHTLSYEQINTLTQDYLEILEKKHSHVVIVVDRSSGIFTRHYYEAFPEMKNHISIYMLESKLEDDPTCNEHENFNKGVGALGLPPKKANSTFLDYMFQIEEASVKSYPSSLPDIHVIKGADKDRRLQALILFVNQEFISINQASSMELTSTLYEFCALPGVDVAVQKDYLSEAELSSDVHYRWRFMTNSKYWVYRCLAEYAKDKSNYDSIAKAYYTIVQNIQKKYGYSPSKAASKNYYQEVKPYSFLDTIQFTFFGISKQGGSLSLPQKIYDTLIPLFQDDYQYLHQKAKCLLWQAGREKDTNAKENTLNTALQQITRAYDLAVSAQSRNSSFTLYHMQVTKALILINYWRYCTKSVGFDVKTELLSRVIASVSQMMTAMTIYPFEDPDEGIRREDMRDLQWFILDLSAGKTRTFLSNSDRQLASDIVTQSTRRHLWGLR